MNIMESKKVLIIAEACDNHMGSLDNAIEMARLAKLAGADVIKYQHHLPEEEMLPDTPMSSNMDEPLFDFLKKYALTLEQHIEVKKYCDTIGITYLCTPFSWKAAQELEEHLTPSFYKIGSGEMTDIPTLKRIQSFEKPIVISTGMSTFDEIKRTYDALIENSSSPIAFMNCISEYPPVYEDVNLNVIGKMKELFPKAVIGHSDHTPDLYTCYAAVALGARIIEKHVILDKRTPGPDQDVSIDFSDLKDLCDGIRKIEASLGYEKKVHKKEEEVRTWAFRSLVAIKEIKAGEILSLENVWSKRPGTGIPSWKMDDYLGKVAKVNISNNTLIKEGDLQ